MEKNSVELEALRAKAENIGKFLEEHNGIDTAVVDVSTRCSWADFFVISTVTSIGHLRGLANQIWEVLESQGLEVRNRHKNPGVDGWELIDCGDIVIHLMSAELRAFYSLEKLWSGPVDEKPAKTEENN
ncbi:MAG: ribosome silencing factor [Sphaerochaetaceae bacterium]|jgi:ribosome-associated protein|nr:ribosome silencing factor [Sphaerochaetaceae bacterium]NLY07154.1 ribosome silencing factor [Spirochaetales bacterium]